MKTWETKNLRNVAIVGHGGCGKTTLTSAALFTARAGFKKPILPLCLPIGEESKLQGVVNVLDMKAYLYPRDKSGKFTVAAVPDDLKEAAGKCREALIESIAEGDDAILERYLEGG